MAKTRDNIQAEVESRLGDSANQIWSEDEIVDNIKEGYDKFISETEYWWKQQLFNDVAGTATQALPADFVTLERVMWNGRRIDPVTPTMQQFRNPNYLTTQGDVWGYMFQGDGPGTIRKVATPAANATNKFGLEFYRLGSSLSSGSSELEMADRDTKYIRFYALWKCYDRRSDGQNPKWAAHFRSRYEEGVARVKARRYAADRFRWHRMGEEPRMRQNGPPVPQLPWNFPDRVNRRRGR